MKYTKFWEIFAELRKKRKIWARESGNFCRNYLPVLQNFLTRTPMYVDKHPISPLEEVQLFHLLCKKKQFLWANPCQFHKNHMQHLKYFFGSLLCHFLFLLYSPRDIWEFLNDRPVSRSLLQWSLLRPWNQSFSGNHTSEASISRRQAFQKVQHSGLQFDTMDYIQTQLANKTSFSNDVYMDYQNFSKNSSFCVHFDEKASRNQVDTNQD